MRALTFCDMGIGNFIFYYPVIKTLSSHYDLTIICPNNQFRDIIDFNLKADYEQEGRCDVAIHNFLTLRRQDILKSWKIPKRIGHVWHGWHKWSFRLTDKIPMRPDKSELYYNSLLLSPLGLEPDLAPIGYPEWDAPQYDIIISRQSSTCEKDWLYFDELIDFLEREGLKIKVLDPKEYKLIQLFALIKKAKLFIGNDSGIAKISANLGIPTIQIFRWFTDCYVRARVNGINLIEPDLTEVTQIINNTLN